MESPRAVPRQMAEKKRSVLRLAEAWAGGMEKSKEKINEIN